MEEWGRGAEESSTGHQLLSDYIIPDIKTTHTARVPAGGPERRAGAESGPASPPSQFPFSPRARSQARKWTPIPALTRGRTPRRCLRLGRRKTPSGANSPATPRDAPEAAAAAKTLQRWAPPQGQRCAGGACNQGFRSIPEASRSASPASYLFGTQAPEPIHMVLSPPSSSAAEAARVAPAGPGAGGPSRALRGRRRVSPTRRPDPLLARAAAARRCGSGGGFVCRGAHGA